MSKVKSSVLYAPHTPIVIKELDQEEPKSGEVRIIAGIKPIKALIRAVKTKEVIISPIFIGAMNKLVKFLLQISSKKSILKPMLVLNRKS